MDGKSFVKQVETLLSLKGIAKERFYSDSGISSATFSQYRTGRYDPSKRTVKKAADFFGMTVEEFEPKRATYKTEQNIIDIVTEILAESCKEIEGAPTPVFENGRPVNFVIIAGRDGSYTEKRLTDEQIKALQTIINQMPEAPEDL